VYIFQLLTNLMTTTSSTNLFQINDKPIRQFTRLVKEISQSLCP